MAREMKIELLSPAGDMERLQATVRFGADAVYLGGTMFGMRAASAYFDEEKLHEAVQFVHAHKVPVYLTCNTLPRNNEIDLLSAYLQMVQRAGVDALIVSDVGVLSLVREILPDIPVHISTQAGIVNYAAANAFYRMGAKRVVLARELSLQEIAQIRANTPPDLELEAFVHGAMCMSFSGRCLLSDYLTGRDANRGDCAQPCRWKYALMEEKRPGEYFPIGEDTDGTYIMNAKDLCMIQHIDKLAEAGITSFKIEGRAKSAYYVSVITNAYRAAIDSYLSAPESFSLPEWAGREVEKVSHRRYCTGFFFGPIQDGQYTENGGYVRPCDVVAVVDDYREGKLICTQRNRFLQGDTLELLEPGKPPVTLTADDLRDVTGAQIDAARHPMMAFSIAFDRPVSRGAILRKERE